MKDNDCNCDISDLYPEIIVNYKRKRGSLKINRIFIKSDGKIVRLIKYRILRFFTSKHDRDINGMLNNIWEFCEPDYYNNCSNITVEGHVDIDELLKIRKIIKEMSKNLYEPTSSKYPNNPYYYDQIYKLRMDQTYGIVGGKDMITIKDLNDFLKISNLSICK